MPLEGNTHLFELNVCRKKLIKPFKLKKCLLAVGEGLLKREMDWGGYGVDLSRKS
jgi:hypothetical protein